MLIAVDEKMPRDIRADLAEYAVACPVCGETLKPPYMWFVFEEYLGSPFDFFLHSDCIPALLDGHYFTPN